MSRESASKNDFFMRIDTPDIFRRNLLGTSKQILAVLRQVYSVKQIRKTKHEIFIFFFIISTSE